MSVRVYECMCTKMSVYALIVCVFACVHVCKDAWVQHADLCNTCVPTSGVLEAHTHAPAPVWLHMPAADLQLLPLLPWPGCWHCAHQHRRLQTLDCTAHPARA